MQEQVPPRPPALDLPDRAGSAGRRGNRRPSRESSPPGFRSRAGRSRRRARERAATPSAPPSPALRSPPRAPPAACPNGAGRAMRRSAGRAATAARKSRGDGVRRGRRARSWRASRLARASGPRTRSAAGVPKLDSRPANGNVAGDVTDCPGGRAGGCKPAEGSGLETRAAPATVTGELALHVRHWVIPGRRCASGDPGARRPVREPSFGAGRGVPGASGAARLRGLPP